MWFFLFDIIIIIELEVSKWIGEFFCRLPNGRRQRWRRWWLWHIIMDLVLVTNEGTGSDRQSMGACMRMHVPPTTKTGTTRTGELSCDSIRAVDLNLLS